MFPEEHQVVWGQGPDGDFADTPNTCDEERNKHAENKGKSLRYLPSHSDIEDRCVDSSMRPGQGRSSIAAQLKGWQQPNRTLVIS